MTQPKLKMATIVLDDSARTVTIINSAGQMVRSQRWSHYDEMLNLVDGIWTHPESEETS